MGTITGDNLTRALSAFFNQDEQQIRKVTEVEKTIDFLSKSITDYLITIRGAEIPDEHLKQLGKLHHVIIDMERIGDRAENIAEYTEALIDAREKMTPQGLSELRDVSDKTLLLFDKSLDIFKNRDVTLFDEIRKMKKEVDSKLTEYTDNHIGRLQEEMCSPHTGVVFTNMLASLERIASHSLTIAFSVEP